MWVSGQVARSPRCIPAVLGKAPRRISRCSPDYRRRSSAQVLRVVPVDLIAASPPLWTGKSRATSTRCASALEGIVLSGMPSPTWGRPVHQTNSYWYDASTRRWPRFVAKRRQAQAVRCCRSRRVRQRCRRELNEEDVEHGPGLGGREGQPVGLPARNDFAQFTFVLTEPARRKFIDARWS